MSVTEGVDYAFAPHPSISGLAEVGKRFAGRYGGPGTAGKHLTLSEAKELSAHGLSVFALAEGTSDGLLGGARVGAAWAQSAHAHFLQCGMPATRPIYFACDFNVTAAQWPSVRQALVAAGSVLGPDRVGIYGGLNAVTWAARDNVARWFFQTYAWSHDVWFERAHVRQYRNDVSLVGGSVDLCRAMVSDFGQWIIGGTPPVGNGGDMDSTQAEQLGRVDWTLNHCYDDNGQPALAHHVWTAGVNGKLSAIDQKLADLAERDGQAGTDVGGMAEVLTEVRALAQLVRDTPLVDAVAVAAAIAAKPEIAATIAAQVAQQLRTITGAITLTGSLSGGITQSQS
jgi:Domain of unknown function (DUF1906)